MIQFAWPWSFVLLPLPLLLRWLLKPAPPPQHAALHVPFLEDFAGADGEAAAGATTQRAWWLAVPAWLLLVCAAARPQWIGEMVELPMSGRDLMLAVDISGSMDRRDFRLRGRAVDRLTATRYVAGQFIERRVGDRLGLILFGRNAYVQTPLTFDRQTVRTLLDEAAIGLAGTETAIGDAIGLGLKRLRGDEVENRVLILLTDGANTAGEVEPVKAAELAAQAGLTIYTVGIGAEEMTERTLFGTRRVNPSADLDEDTLRAIADLTGGRYFRARSTGELNEIYTLIDELEPRAEDVAGFRPMQALFFWPLTASVLLGLLLLLTRTGLPLTRAETAS